MNTVNRALAAVTRRLRAGLSYVWLPAALFALWRMADDDTSLYFPPPGKIFTAVRDLWLFDHAQIDLIPSLQILGSGLLVDCTVGAAIGMTLGSMPRLMRAVQPEIEFVRSLPGVAVLPLAILVLGLGDSMRIFVVAFGAMWPVLLNTMHAVRGIDLTIRDVEAAFGLGWSARIWRVRLPAVLPQLLAGVRVSVYISLSLVAVSEMQGAGRGVGNFVFTAQRNWAVTDMWSGMVVFGVLGYVLSVGFRVIERRLLRGHPPLQVTKG